MPTDGSATRTKLIDEATRSFAENGVYQASLIEITRRAGQRNRGAIHYHFTSRTGLLSAVLDRHADFLAHREGELLEIAIAAGDDDVAAVVEAIVRPASELARSGWRGRCFLVILAELIQEDPATLEPEISAVLARTGGHAVYEVLGERTAHVPAELRQERFALATGFILRAVADRARELGHRRQRRLQLDDETFVENLITMVTAAVTAPVVGSVPAPGDHAD